MFNQGHQLGFSNCKALLWVFYLDLNLSRLPSSGMDMAKFIMELMANPSPCLDTGPDTFHYGVSSQMKDSLDSSGIAKDPSPTTKKPLESENEGGQSSKMGSWSDSDDLQPPGMVIIDFGTQKNQSFIRNLFCSFFIFVVILLYFLDISHQKAMKLLFYALSPNQSKVFRFPLDYKFLGLGH